MSKRSDIIIDRIQEIRGENNKNWMRLLRIAFRESPKEAGEVMTRIGICDVKVNELTRALSKLGGNE